MRANRDDRFDGQVILVTGAGSRSEGVGNGRAASILLARAGAKVALLDATPAWAEATAKLIRDEGGACLVIEADMAVPEQCAAAVAKTVDAWARPDGLVNNVGIGGPEPLRPAGEAGLVNGIAAMSTNGCYGSTRICEGIVSCADLRLGAAVDEVLEAYIRARGGHFRGIRHSAAWDVELQRLANVPEPHPFADPRFHEGFAWLALLGLSCDAWLYHLQIDELTALARAFPTTTWRGSCTPTISMTVGSRCTVTTGRPHRTSGISRPMAAPPYSARTRCTCGISCTSVRRCRSPGRFRLHRRSCAVGVETAVARLPY